MDLQKVVDISQPIQIGGMKLVKSGKKIGNFATDNDLFKVEKVQLHLRAALPKWENAMEFTQWVAFSMAAD